MKENTLESFQKTEIIQDFLKLINLAKNFDKIFEILIIEKSYWLIKSLDIYDCCLIIYLLSNLI